MVFILLRQADLPENAIAQSSADKSSLPKKLTSAKIKKKAEQVTVQIKTIQDKSIGTAVIVDKREFFEVLQQDESPHYLYDVLTAHHVIREIQKKGEEIVVITPDKIERNVSLDSATQIETNDLAVFHIVSANKYPAAKLGNSDNLEKVFSAGFPCEEDFCKDELEFRSGIIAPKVILEGNSNFQGGFKIGHTIKLYDGMSGSPIFDTYGFVVGINSRKKYPNLIFANNEYRYPDGSIPSKIIQEFIPYFAWGIAIEEYIEYKKTFVSPDLLEKQTRNNFVTDVKSLFTNLNSNEKKTLSLLLRLIILILLLTFIVLLIIILYFIINFIILYFIINLFVTNLEIATQISLMQISLSTQDSDKDIIPRGFDE